MAEVDPRVRMATDIAAQFRHLPEDDAVDAVVTHLRTFWAPSMRTRLVQAASDDPEQLDPVVRLAARTLAEAPVTP